MPVEGRGLSSRQTQDVVRDWRLGNLSTPIKCSETAEGVTRESEGRSRLSLLRAVRQDLPGRHPGACLCPMPLQQGRAGRGRSGLRGRRSVRGGAVARRTGACAQGGDVPTGSDQTSVYPESERQTSAAGHLDPAGSGVHDSSNAGARTDLRSRSSARAVRLPAGPQRPAGGGRGGRAAVPGHPEVVDADLADYFGSIPHAELMQSVARRIVDRRVLHLIKMWLECAPLKKPMIEDGRHARPRPRTVDAAFRRAHPSHRCWRICTCAGSCWVEEARAGEKLGSRIVTYADDLVILCRNGQGR
jgi:hypothetical protein